MIGFSPFSVTRGMLVRMLADAAMTNLALAAALLLRMVVDMVSAHPAVTNQELFDEYIGIYAVNAPVLTLMCLLIFGLSGFYTYGRVYQSRYKALMIVTAVAQAYLLYGCATFLMSDALGWRPIPRGSLVTAFLLNLGAALASRTWTSLWETVIQIEQHKKVRQPRRSGKNVLVIGGAGYIGSALLPKLLNNGYSVRVLDMFLYGEEPIAGIRRHPRLELVKGDFRNVQEVVSATKGMDAVVHLGAIVGDPACNLDESVTIAVNLSATQMIAQVAKASGVSRFLFASTCSVYGASEELLDEHSEVRPISLYGHTKLAAEWGLKRMADEWFKPTILRFATIYGQSGRTRFDLVVNLLAAKAKTEGVITINGGDQWRPFVHVDDAALAILAALKAPLEVTGNETFNVGSDDQNYTINQIGELVKQHVFGARLIIDADSTDKRNYRVSFTKIRKKLSFQPQWTVQRGIQQVIEAIAASQVGDYRDPKYSNVKHLTESRLIEAVRVKDDWTKELAESQSGEHAVLKVL
jgi:nucleoside-diphosphate-sugar epimerase